MSEREYQQINIECLMPFKDHPFKLYEGQRFDDMVKSVKENGVLLPIVVRPIESGEFEILSGHNRVNAAKEAELREIPAIVCDDLSDEEAKLIVTETNLIQRSFADLSHSEKAAVLSTHYHTSKQSGRHKELIKEIEEILSPVGTGTNTIRDVSGDYGLSKNTVARYLRIDRLIPELKSRLDGDSVGDKLSVRTAVSLSYLRKSEQKIVEKLLAGMLYHIDMKKAGELRKASEERELTKSDIEQLLGDDTREKRRAVRINEEIYAKYFDEEKTPDEISDIVEKALQMWFENS